MDKNDEGKKTIGLTAEAQTILDSLMASVPFPDETAASKFACAFAIRKGIKPVKPKSPQTKWAIGSYDASQELRNALAAFYPDMHPDEALQAVVNQGLVALAGEYRKEGEWDIGPLLATL